MRFLYMSNWPLGQTFVSSYGKKIKTKNHVPSHDHIKKILQFIRIIAHMIFLLLLFIKS